jgi:hypothetical protein
MLGNEAYFWQDSGLQMDAKRSWKDFQMICKNVL